MAPGIGHGSQHCWRGGRRPLLSFAVAMRVLLTGKRQPGSAANLSGSQPQEVDADMVFPKPSDTKAAGVPAVHFRASRRAPGDRNLPLRMDVHTL